MTFLPIVTRELIVSARRPRTYWVRFLAALMAVGLLAAMWFLFAKSESPAQLSLMLFAVISGLAFAYCFLSGISVTADCLSEEKREGTLGLLFLTDLRGYDVVFGKLVANSVDSFYRLLAILPVMAIPLLLGGLTPGEFWRMVLVLLNTLFFSLSAGMIMSAICRQERKARAGTLALILLIAGGLPTVSLVLGAMAKYSDDYSFFALPSPWFAYGFAFDKLFKGTKGAADAFRTSVLLTHWLSWCFLGLASLIVRHAWQDKPAGARRVSWAERWQRWGYGPEAERKAFRTRLLEVNPFFWLAARWRLKPAFLLGFLGLCGCLWFWLALKYRDDLLNSVVYATTAILLHTLIKGWIAVEACQPLAEAKRTGALELVLCTPLKVEEMLAGHFLALKRQFGGAITLIVIADLAMMLAGLHDPSTEEASLWLLACAAWILMFVADAFTLGWVGFWLGLKAKRADRATTQAFLRVLVLPWAVFITVFIAVNFAEQHGGYDLKPTFWVAVWFGIGMLNNLILFTSAQRSLLGKLRLLASEQFS
ncbi:MAG: ABC transporter permease, partial [Verrucomicrobiota bacterium]